MRLSSFVAFLIAWGNVSLSWGLEDPVVCSLCLDQEPASVGPLLVSKSLCTQGEKSVDPKAHTHLKKTLTGEAHLHERLKVRIFIQQLGVLVG